MTSVIIPVYNGARTIRKAILSVTQQQGNEPCEIIVVDDGSTDNTQDVLSQLQTETRNMEIHVIKQKNMGPGAARNVALERARGGFVVFLDADDYLEPMAIKRMREKMTKDKTEACVAGTRYLLGGIPIKNAIECWHKLNDGVINAWEENFLVEITPAVRAKMFTHESLEGLEFAEGIKWEDLACIPAALAKAGKVSVLNEPVYNYRLHLNTTVRDFLFHCRTSDIIVVLDKLEENLKWRLPEGAFEKYQKQYLSMLTLHTVFRMQNVMTWVDEDRFYKRGMIAGLEVLLNKRHLGWRKDDVLCHPEYRYKDPFFNMMLKILYKKYL